MPTTLGIDAAAVQNQVTVSSNPPSSGFDSTMATIGYASSLAAPTASVYASSGGMQASIVSAAINAAADPYGTSSSLYATNGFGSSSLSSTTGATNYLTGGGTSYAVTDSGTGLSDAETNLASMQENGLQLIAMQTAVQNTGNQISILTNVIKAKGDAERGIVQNIRS